MGEPHRPSRPSPTHAIGEPYSSTPADTLREAAEKYLESHNCPASRGGLPCAAEAALRAALDTERARLRSATRRYEDAEHNMLLLNDDLIAEPARHAALVAALDNLARHHELERVAGNTHIHPDKCEFVMQADRALRAAHE